MTMDDMNFNAAKRPRGAATKTKQAMRTNTHYENGRHQDDGGDNHNPNPFSHSSCAEMTAESTSREFDLPAECMLWSDEDEHEYEHEDGHINNINVHDADGDDSGKELITMKPKVSPAFDDQGDAATSSCTGKDADDDESPRCAADQNDEESASFIVLYKDGGPDPPTMCMSLEGPGFSQWTPDSGFRLENYKEHSKENLHVRTNSENIEVHVHTEGSEYDAREKSPTHRHRDFPLEPFPSNVGWDDDSSSSASFPSDSDSNISHRYGNGNGNGNGYGYGSFNSSAAPNQTKRSDSYPRSLHDRSDSMASDQTPMFSNTKSNPSSRYEYSYIPPQKISDVCSTSSEATPIVSNSPKMPLSPSSTGKHSEDTYSTDLKDALLDSPSRNVIVSSLSPRKRPEPLLKILSRQQHVEKLCKDAIGTKQPTSCRDLPFAILFILHLIAILVLSMHFVPMAFGHMHYLKNMTLETEETLGMHFANANILSLMLVSGMVAIVISLLALSLMTAVSDRFIPIALYLSITLSFLWAIVGVVRSQHNFLPLTGLFAFGGTVAYTFTVWEKIPFESANLYTALKAIRSTRFIVGLAVVFEVVVLAWAMLFLLIFIGMYDYFEDRIVDPNIKIGCYIFLGLSFNWTIQTLVHMMQVCISGYIGQWWFRQKLDSTEKLDAIGESIVRATVHSFGSICFGSMFIGISKFLRKIAEPIRPNGDEAPLRLFVMFQEFIVSCIDTAYFMFHEYAFVYVGMYGYDFLEAGKKANILFKKRGWTEIVYDDLLENLLTIVSLVIGGTCGWISVIIEGVMDIPLISTEKPAMVAFGIGFVLGVILSNILFSIITSSVHAVLCCFAGSPVEFRNNHPICSHKMREAWRESWPGYVDFVDDGRNTHHMRKISSGASPFMERNSREALFV